MGIFFAKPQVYCTDPARENCSLISYEHSRPDVSNYEENPELTSFLGFEVRELNQRYPNKEEELNYITQRCQSQYPGSVGKIGGCCPDSLTGNYEGFRFAENGQVDLSPGLHLLNLGKVDGDDVTLCQSPSCSNPANHVACTAACSAEEMGTILDARQLCLGTIKAMNEADPNNIMICPTPCDSLQEVSSEVSSEVNSEVNSEVTSEVVTAEAVAVQDDNTMLYLGISGFLCLLIIIAIILFFILREKD